MEQICPYCGGPLEIVALEWVDPDDRIHRTTGLGCPCCALILEVRE